MSIKSIVCQIGLSRWRACAIGASLAASATLASPGASAQQMPDSGAWLNDMMRLQGQWYNEGQNAVEEMQRLCISNPGACQPWQAEANRRLQEEYTRNFRLTQDNYNSTYNTNEMYDICVIQQRPLLQFLPNGTWYRVC